MTVGVRIGEETEITFDSVVDGSSNVLIVANAYERIDKMYMSPDLQFLYSFVFETPLYGVAKNPYRGLPENSRLMIATHHAPSSLLPWFLSDCDIDYDVEFISPTRTILMLWSVFIRKED